MSQTDDVDNAPPRAADEWLVVRCQLGEPDALDELVAVWHGPVWGYVRRMVGRDDEARDVAQDVWLRVVRALPGLRDASRFRGWLFGIARRVLMDRLRRQYAMPTPADLDLHELAADVVDAHADLAALDRALLDVPALEREVLTLFYLEDLTLAELAQALDIPVGTVKSRLFRARRLLRAVMDKERHS